ncbi:MAG: secretin N-terminal domain-containing protein, partial [Planctomycetota bacterium]
DMLKVGSPAPWASACDERTNSIIVKGPPELVAQAAGLIKQLDRPTDQAGESAKVMKLMPLSHAEARELAAVIEDVLISGRRRSAAPIEIVADQRTNTIVLAGPEPLVLRASDLIAKLDRKSKAAAPQKKAEAKTGKGAAEKGKRPQGKGKGGKGKGKADAAPAPKAPKNPKAPAEPASPKKPKGGKKAKGPNADAQAADPAESATTVPPPRRDT